MWTIYENNAKLAKREGDETTHAVLPSGSALVAVGAAQPNGFSALQQQFPNLHYTVATTTSQPGSGTADPLTAKSAAGAQVSVATVDYQNLPNITNSAIASMTAAAANQTQQAMPHQSAVSDPQTSSVPPTFTPSIGMYFLHNKTKQKQVFFLTSVMV